MKLTLQSIRDVNIKSSTQQDFLGSFNANCAEFKINTFLRIAHFMAQVCYECDGFRIQVENLNYKPPQRLMQVWPKRFATIEIANQYINNPQKLGNYVYADRLGNGGPETNDGYNLRGHGALQTTGKSWYRLISKKLFSIAQLALMVNSAGLYLWNKQLDQKPWPKKYKLSICMQRTIYEKAIHL